MIMTKEQADTIALHGVTSFMLATERAHLTVEQMAGIMGVSPATVYNWRKTPPKDFQNVTNILRVTRKLADMPPEMVATFGGRANAEHRLKSVLAWLEK